MEMEIPVIDFSKLAGEERSKTMKLLHHACERWGFFMVENHGVDTELMENVKQMVTQHYEHSLKESFYGSDVVKCVENKKESIRDADWESTYFIWHHPTSNINQLKNFPNNFGKTMEQYIEQLMKLAENLSELMCENLGLEKNHIKESFSGSKGQSIGTKVAIYPECPNPELVRGLREHTDAGGIILLLQDDQVPGLEFFKDEQWVKIPPSKNNRIFVNTGDQLEILSNGMYKSTLHRVLAQNDGNRLSIATFYNPASDAMISPAPKLLYPENVCFQDYLKHYGSTKFGEKGPRFETMKKLQANGH
ncbi:1-aminocyclopropane-1-carboxylate oxidase 1 [Ipomoea triloba]|uniref:1-aminocyclopropane-1-carboxylate oxidase 1 n=1 Tax=Ipomoea triloba TaxID=35885 RepID=UPI00125E1233|nr:1-aminocyclopropane-1-carboxylate oxidase 1 [Ipomoea triloba]